MIKRNITPMKFALAMAAGVALTMSACSKQEESGSGSSATNEMETKMASAEVFNATCPMMDGNEVSADAGTVEFNGKTIGFCCEECIGKWKNLSDQEKSDKMTELKQAMAEAADEMKEGAEEAMDEAKDMMPGEGGGG